MKARLINRERIEGWVYEHDLAVKKVQNQNSPNYGKDFIQGTLDIQTDDQKSNSKGLNVVTVHFTYVTELTSKGQKNDTYTTLKNIIENGKTVVIDGQDNATMVRVDTALGLNDFYTSRNGEETLVSSKRNDGGFVRLVNKLGEESSRNTFEFDMLINGIRFIEKDEERHIDEDYLIVKGAVFNFRKAMLPVELTVRTPGGIKYFESLEPSPSNPIFTKVWGKIKSQAIVEKVEEGSAFGEAAVKEYTRNVREWEITGAATTPYEIGDERDGITVEEIKQAMADREVYLAGVKKRADEYAASRAAATTNTASTDFSSSAVSAAAGGFNF